MVACELVSCRYSMRPRQESSSYMCSGSQAVASTSDQNRRSLQLPHAPEYHTPGPLRLHDAKAVLWLHRAAESACHLAMNAESEQHNLSAIQTADRLADVPT